jgi:hypothetical protein
MRKRLETLGIKIRNAYMTSTPITSTAVATVNIGKGME